MLGRVLSEGRAVAAQDQILPLIGKGGLQDAWFDFSFNPILGEDNFSIPACAGMT